MRGCSVIKTYLCSYSQNINTFISSHLSFCFFQLQWIPLLVCNLGLFLNSSLSKYNPANPTVSVLTIGIPECTYLVFLFTRSHWFPATGPLFMLFPLYEMLSLPPLTRLTHHLLRKTFLACHIWVNASCITSHSLSMLHRTHHSYNFCTCVIMW